MDIHRELADTARASAVRGLALAVLAGSEDKNLIPQLFTALGFQVRRLRRYQIGSLRLKGIPLRGVKQLSSKEIQSLFVVPVIQKGRPRVLPHQPANSSTLDSTSVRGASSARGTGSS
jgi:hypothetical protein